MKHLGLQEVGSRLRRAAQLRHARSSLVAAKKCMLHFARRRPSHGLYFSSELGEFNTSKIVFCRCGGFIGAIATDWRRDGAAGRVCACGGRASDAPDRRSPQSECNKSREEVPAVDCVVNGTLKGYIGIPRRMRMRDEVCRAELWLRGVLRGILVKVEASGNDEIRERS